MKNNCPIYTIQLFIGFIIYTSFIILTVQILGPNCIYLSIYSTLILFIVDLILYSKLVQKFSIGFVKCGKYGKKFPKIKLKPINKWNTESDTISDYNITHSHTSIKNNTLFYTSN
ncbi:hypothetical protein QLL95_gp0834 [Cotonvirus japonicus]|uniref:Uncharacterized protein n=1 Tax=Cotonvirus japonicus TaxID=2811091 RepID=A0ABM7NT22_9VIRU|nr:hypothetical protein QLL95_gp0834 [Cotonvirus japonicus]BCS83289.1 hypothetical protein [Cotonvirus japonicus]